MKPADSSSKPNRVLEVHFYEWRLLSWATSDTRDRLDAAGRGIYRELLDQCYAKGSFPADLDYIQRKCACTLEEYERTWPIIKKQFRLDARKNEYRNAVCDAFRRAHFSYIETQRNNGALGGRPARHKSSKNSALETSGLQVAKPGGYENDNPTESLKKEERKEINKEERKQESVACETPPAKPPSSEQNGTITADLCAWYEQEFKGEWLPDTWLSFPRYVDGENAEAFRRNLPLWMRTRKYRDGFGSNSVKFLSSRVWLKPPNEALIEGKASKSGWDSLV